MKYILYLFTLALVFVAGMLVGNFYLPEGNTSLAATISIPDLDKSNPALADITTESARQNLQLMEQALNSCPAVAMEEKERLVNQINMLFALQDFYIKKAVYETEIAKNIPGTQTSSQFTRAASEYAAAKRATEALLNTLFPVVEPEPEPTPEPELSAEPAAEPTPSPTPEPTKTPAEADAVAEVAK